MSILIYGANGYSGRLIVKVAAAQKLPIILAGRNYHNIKHLAAAYKLPFRVFDLQDSVAIIEQLYDVKILINCAGPFPQTAPQLVAACLQTGTHYLDINGEIEQFEWMKQQDAAAQKAGILVLPGVGFDVVPSDCMAKMLAQNFPEGKKLTLAFMNKGGGISHGTLTTMLTRLGKGGAARIQGQIKKMPLGALGKKIDFGYGKQFCMSIPWGDVSTAAHGTQLTDTVVYSAVPIKVYCLLKGQFLFNWILRSKIFKKIAQRYIDKHVFGPTAEQNQQGRSLLWARLSAADGQYREMRLEGPESYWLTALATVYIARQCLNSTKLTGYHTPATAFGPNLIKQIPGIQLSEITAGSV